MEFDKRTVSRRAARVERRIEAVLNRALRTRDGVLGRLHLGGRKANYDDVAYEFKGGPSDVLRELLQAFDVPIPRQSAWERTVEHEVFFGLLGEEVAA